MREADSQLQKVESALQFLSESAAGLAICPRLRPIPPCFPAKNNLWGELGRSATSPAPALGVRLEIYRQAQSWALMEAVARELLRRIPAQPDPWLDLAFAVRRSESLQAAKELLEKAEAMFPKNATIHFNLGCYDCQMGDIGEAKRRVEKAIFLDRKFQMIAQYDPDLEPIWESLSLISNPSADLEKI